MDHDFIQERNIAERYILGRLEPSELARFEEHFIDCQQCIETLETSGMLRDGLRRMEAKPAVPMMPRRPARFWPAFGAIAAMFAVSITTAGWLAYRNSQLTDNLASARLTSRKATGKVAELQSQLLALEVKDRNSSLPAVVYSLESVRSAPRGKPPAQMLSIPAEPSILVLLVNQEPVPEFTSYRARLRDSAAKEIARFDEVRHQANSTIALSFNSRLLSPGVYEVVLEGRTTGGRFAPAAQLRFRAVPVGK